jgi:hypothetical protein
MVDGKQLTVVWHVDDIRVSSELKKAVDDFIEWCRAKWEDPTITEMKPSRGKVHDYLGMILDYSEPGKVKIQMKDYVAKTLNEFKYQDELRATKPVTSPAAEKLFSVNDKTPKLDKAMGEEFHGTVAKLLFLTKRARPDLQPTVPFLCTRVKQPDQDDWKKLLRLLKYLELTANLILTLEADPDDDVLHARWFPDAAFAVHPDFKSHTGAVLSFGKGATKTVSSKQRLNTRSSTEAELIGVDDIAPLAVWTMLFLEAQGYKSRTTIYQDNTSAILLEKNGKESSLKRTRHINIKYFYITDCVEKKFFKIEYCPTEDMLGDFPSKPLHGALFHKHLRSIMNLPEEDISHLQMYDDIDDL